LFDQIDPFGVGGLGVGPLGRIRERAAAWRALGSEGRVGTLILGMQQPEHLGAIADILLG
jgi:hypothetical protein